uniref:Uncharacterized protein n=1 Tax=viral metagenome TaxID=1070528 RepID=A0A6C0I0Z0_9ZZZZ
MKICIIYRGEHERNYIQYINSLNNVNNWQKYIFSDLQKHNYIFDIIFITYNTTILNELKDKMNPKEIILCETENSSQVNNINIVNEYVQKNKDIYDRFIILRFDIIYKTPITTWKYWYETGITVPGKDITWESTKFCNDILFMIDKSHVHHFDDAVNYMLSIDTLPVENRMDKYQPMPHHIGQYLYHNNIHVNFMYHIESGTNHPHYIFVRNDPNSIYL